VSLWVQIGVQHAGAIPLTPAYLVAPAAISLALIRARWWHALGLAAFTAIYLVQFFGHAIGQSRRGDPAWPSQPRKPRRKPSPGTRPRWPPSARSSARARR